MKTLASVSFCFLATLASAQTATVNIDAARVDNHVNPGMYAAFVEMMAEDVKWGMTAEMIHDRSFEEPANYLGLPANWQLEPDERNDNVGIIKFAQTTDDAYPRVNQATKAPEHSLLVTVAPGDIADIRHGFSQGHLSIRANQTYVGYLWAKLPSKNGYTGAITAALEEDNTDGKTYAITTLQKVSDDWAKYEFSLKPTTTDRFAKLTFLFDGKGALLIDQISLEPADALTQVRSDSEQMIGALHPSFIRWPGGNVAQDYHWKWGIGPRDQRPVWNNTAWSNAPEPGDLGTDEYLALCTRLHIQPNITVNVDGAGATPEEAAEWVEYVNGPATSKYGAMRAANGHPEPYHVTQWELGNEIFGDWVRGHVTAEQYGKRAAIYAQAMRAVDPSIQLIAVGEGVARDSDEWNGAVLKEAGLYIDYLAIHDYTSQSQNAKSANPRATMMGRAGEYEQQYRHVAELAKRLVPAKNIKLIVNEWNLFYDAATIESMEGAVYASRMMNGFQRDGDVVYANCISDLLNGWAGGVIQASRDRVYGTAQYYAIKMYAEHLGTDRLHTDTTSPDLQPSVPMVDAVATRSADGSKIYVNLSNADATHAIATTINLGGASHSANVRVDVLTAKPGTLNTFSNPTAIVPTTKNQSCAKTCTIALPPNSVATLTFTASH